MTGPAAPASRDDNGTANNGRPAISCPVCATVFLPVRRQSYCSTNCRKTAFRRHHNRLTPPAVPAGRDRRDVSAYQCDTCGERQLRQQRCPDCNTFGGALGLAGTCPHCDGIIAANDLNQH